MLTMQGTLQMTEVQKAQLVAQGLGLKLTWKGLILYPVLCPVLFMNLPLKSTWPRTRCGQRSGSCMVTEMTCSVSAHLPVVG